VNILNADGSLTRSIVASVPAVKVTKEDLDDFGRTNVRNVYEAMRVRVEAPDYAKTGPVATRRPVIGQLLVDNGWILLQRLDETDRPFDRYSETGLMQWLVVDPSGKPVSRFALPVRVTIARFANCKLYGHTAAPDGTPLIVRFSVPSCITQSRSAAESLPAT
jgi:hypothetical protein